MASELNMERPAVLRGSTTKVKTGCGNLYVVVNTNGDRPLEVFSYLGKAGGCSNCQNGALTRSITLGLRYGVPAEQICKSLEGLRCPNPSLWPREGRVLSCADGIAKVLKREIERLKALGSESEEESK